MITQRFVLKALARSRLTTASRLATMACLNH